MNLKEYRLRYQDAHKTPGWEAIDAELGRLYPNQKPRHFAPPVHHALGGPDPIDGISIYESSAGGVAHHHFVTYGFSQLYFDEEAFGRDFSKFGFELTFRLKPYAPDNGMPSWALSFLQNIARYVFKSGKWFEPYHIMTAKGPIRSDTDTAIQAMLFVPDPELPPIQTLHGRVEFLQVFGITDREWLESECLLEKTEALAAKHRACNPYFITDLERRDD